MYPVPGQPLVPRALVSVLGDEQLPTAVIQRSGLKARRFGDLDVRVWTDCAPAAVVELAEAVIATLRGRYALLSAIREPILEQRPELEALSLEKRTRNALLKSGLVEGGRLRLTSLAVLAGVRGLGARSLLDLLTAVEALPEAQGEPAAGPEDPATPVAAPAAPARSSSPAVLEVAGKLRRKRWAREIHAGDPRIGPMLRALDPEAATPHEAADVLGSAGYTPAETRSITAAVRGFIADVDALRRLTLEEELEQVVTLLTNTPRAKAAVLARAGLGGDEPVTLDVAGRAVGLTRERVRQIERDFRGRAHRYHLIWLPALDRSLKRVSQLLPASPASVVSTLVAEGRTSRPFSLASLTSAAQLFGRELPLVQVFGGEMLVRPGDETPAASIRTAARRLVEHWGATTLADVEARVEEDVGGSVDAVLLLAIVESLDGFSWLDRDRGWFWIRGVPRNRLLNTVGKILSVAGSIELTELRSGVGRPHRMKGFRPPREVLAGLCIGSGLYTRAGDRIVGGPALPDWRVALGSVEQTIVEVLFEHGPVMRREDLEHIAVDERGVNRHSFYVYLTYSPVLERFAPGVMGLRGAPVTAAQVEALIPPRVRHQVLQDNGWTDAGEIWVAFRISPAAESTGVLGAPAALRGVARGSFPLWTADDRPVGTLVIQQSMWGLSPFFRRWGVEAGDYVVIRVSLASRRAVIESGDEELLVRYQEGE